MISVFKGKGKLIMDFSSYIGVTEGFPKAGISFKDITPLLADPKAFKEATDELAAKVKEWGADIVVGPESRGFVVGAPVAYSAGVGFVMARKKGKLPGGVISKTYTLEYNTATIEIKKGVIKKGTKVVLVDDLLATGGTLKAVKELLEEAGAKVVGAATLIELTDLKGKEEFKDIPYVSLIKFPH